MDWLQAAVDARSGTVDLGGMGMGMGMGGSHLGWSNTLESLAVAGGQKSEVGQMHPDANLRKVGRGSTGLKVMRLVGQDDLDEKELLRTAWLLVRTGKLGDAMRLCESRGQPWRAAAMGGGGVIGSGVLKEENVREQDDVDGEYGATYSPAQGLWQEMCWQLRCVFFVCRHDLSCGTLVVVCGVFSLGSWLGDAPRRQSWCRSMCCWKPSLTTEHV